MKQTYPKTSTDWLIRLINHDTVSSQSNLELINDVQAFLQSYGLTPILTHNEDNTKANLFATIYNKDDPTQGKTGGIVLSGHTDVVPTDGQAWTHNPFDGYVKDGKVYGRGACDMKGFIACVLAFAPTAIALAKDNRLKTPLHIALSFDEEVGCLGAPLILEDLRQRGVVPEYCIVGEPTQMQVVTAHKGISVYTCSVHGKSVHSSLTPSGVNAISYAACMITHIDNLAQRLKSHSIDNDFNVPFGTLSVGTIEGGIATNIVPNLCKFTFEYRNLPFNDPKELMTEIYDYADTLSAKMQKIDKDTGIVITQTENVPAMSDKDSKELQKLALALVGKEPTKVAYATEGGQFTNAGIATIICGPGSIEQAHKADEYVAISELDKCDRVLQKLFVPNA